MARPYGITVDAAGRLWVADLSNNRVLRFDNASTLESGDAATRVLGQADFTTGTANTGGISASTMWSPIGVYVDVAGRLWVTERDNKRVLRFDNAATKPNGAAADGVLGEPNFTTNTGGLSASLITRAYGITGNSSDRIWIADRDNNRVLRFDNASGKANGAAADGVIGQTDFVSNVDARTQSGLSGPRGVFVDLFGKLYVSDEGNNRIMIYNNALGIGQYADNLLGQSDFISATNPNPPTGSSVNYPEFLVVDNATNQIWLADEYNNRILRYNTSGIPTAIDAENDGSSIPTGYSLSQNYPNPFNPSTTIKFSLPEASQVSLKIFDMLGREVVTLVNEELSAGNYNYQWNGSRLASGVYLYRFTATSSSGNTKQQFIQVKKLMLLK